jgi:hypothetical protein
MSKAKGQIKGQDIVIALKLHLVRKEDFTLRSIAADLKISVSEISNGLSRLAFAGLITPDKKMINISSLLEFIVHGVPYAFPIKPGVITRGVPTSFCEPSLNGFLIATEKFVWPHPSGKIKGSSIEPLYSTVPSFIESDPDLHRLLALTDMIRVGRVREKKLAIELLQKEVRERSK